MDALRSGSTSTLVDWQNPHNPTNPTQNPSAENAQSTDDADWELVKVTPPNSHPNSPKLGPGGNPQLGQPLVLGPPGSPKLGPPPATQSVNPPKSPETSDVESESDESTTSEPDPTSSSTTSSAESEPESEDETAKINAQQSTVTPNSEPTVDDALPTEEALNHAMQQGEEKPAEAPPQPIAAHVKSANPVVTPNANPISATADVKDEPSANRPRRRRVIPNAQPFSGRPNRQQPNSARFAETAAVRRIREQANAAPAAANIAPAPASRSFSDRFSLVATAAFGILTSTCLSYFGTPPDVRKEGWLFTETKYNYDIRNEISLWVLFSTAAVALGMYFSALSLIGKNRTR